MRKRVRARVMARATSCPLCGHELGALIDEEWVPMPLDEYREHAETELNKAKGRTDTCIACRHPNCAGVTPTDDEAKLIARWSATLCGN